MPNVIRTAATLALVCSSFAALAGFAPRSALAQSPAPSTAPSATPSGAPSPAASPVAIVHTKDFKYNPTPLTVHVGDTVEFVNDDPTAHTVTASDGTSFDSGNMDKGVTWRHTFTKAGTYKYTCTYHSFMNAVVVVEAAK